MTLTKPKNKHLAVKMSEKTVFIHDKGVDATESSDKGLFSELKAFLDTSAEPAKAIKLFE